MVSTYGVVVVLVLLVVPLLVHSATNAALDQLPIRVSVKHLDRKHHRDIHTGPLSNSPSKASHDITLKVKIQRRQHDRHWRSRRRALYPGTGNSLGGG